MPQSAIAVQLTGGCINRNRLIRHHNIMTVIIVASHRPKRIHFEWANEEDSTSLHSKVRCYNTIDGEMSPTASYSLECKQSPYCERDIFDVCKMDAHFFALVAFVSTTVDASVCLFCVDDDDISHQINLINTSS